MHSLLLVPVPRPLYVLVLASHSLQPVALNSSW
jgi:hypothetical protein